MRLLPKFITRSRVAQLQWWSRKPEECKITLT
jgi:hypothetical protein